MIAYSARARSQLQALLAHYESLSRTEAVRNLTTAMASAEVRIEHNPLAGLPAPRPYPWLADLGFHWIKSQRYWIAYTGNEPLAIVAVFHDTADIPNRIVP